MTYVAVATYHKFVLNWIVGPLWLVLVVVVGPDAVGIGEFRRADVDVARPGAT